MYHPFANMHNRRSARANAYKDYGDAAVMSLILEALPKIAAEIAAPLANTKDIVIVSGSEGGVTGEVTKLLSQLPPTVQALTGVDLTKVCVVPRVCPACTIAVVVAPALGAWSTCYAPLHAMQCNALLFPPPRALGAWST